MKKLILLTVLLLVPSAAGAYTTHQVTPQVVDGVTTSWIFEFYFTKPPSKEHGSLSIQEFACLPDDGHRVSGFPCHDTQEDAAVAARKEANIFESRCRSDAHCDIDKISELEKKNGTQ